MPFLSRSSVANDRGVTLPEIMIGLTITAVASAFAFGSSYEYRQSTTTSRAARVIGADVLLTRSLAIRGRQPVSLVANETLRSYVVRDAAGNVLHQRVFDLNSELSLTTLDVATAGDSLTFDSRGILISGGSPQVFATRGNKIRTITFNALGRSQIN